MLIRIKIREKWTGIYFTIFFHFYSAMCIRIVMNNLVNIEYTDSIKRSSEKERGFVGRRTLSTYLSVWFPVRSITCKSFYILMIMLLCHIHKYFSRKNHYIHSCYMSFFVNCWRLGNGCWQQQQVCQHPRLLVQITCSIVSRHAPLNKYKKSIGRSFWLFCLKWV